MVINNFNNKDPELLAISLGWHKKYVTNNIQCIQNRNFGWIGIISFYRSFVLRDRLQPKTSHFYTRHLLRVNCKIVSQLSQPMFLSFSYLNIARHNLVIELCRALIFLNFCIWLYSKLAYSFVANELLALFNNAKFHFYYSRELSVFFF